MKLKLCTALLTAAVIFAPLSLVASGAPDSATVKRNAIENFGRLPLSFEPTESASRFVARSGNYTVSVGAHESSVIVSGTRPGEHHALYFAFENANPTAELEASELQPGVTNYYIGRDPKKWRLGVSSYAKLRATNVYPGVDVVYYGDHRQLEFDFDIAPNADPSAISLTFAGADKLYKDSSGELVAEVGSKSVRFAKPYAYQNVDGTAHSIAADYALADGKVHLRLGDYDHSRELIVDPYVTYATYLGGGMGDVGNGIAVDNAGAVYVTGQTCSSNFPEGTPASPNPGGYPFEGACDAYVTKYGSEASNRTPYLFTTILGGTNPANATATGNGIVVDNASTNPQVYVVGTTNIEDLPGYTMGLPYQGGDSDAFITILSATGGTLVRTSYLGGSSADSGYGIAVDQASPANVIVVGQTCSQDFPGYSAFELMIERCVAFITELDNQLDVPVLDPTVSAFAPAPAPPAGEQYYFSEFYNGQQTLGPPATAIWTPYTNFPKYAIVLDSLTPPHSQMALNSGCSGEYLPPSTITSNPVPNWNATLNGITVDGLPLTQDHSSCGTPISWKDIGTYQVPVNHQTIAYGVAVDPSGDVYVAGGTDTPTLYPYSELAGSGAWVLKVHGGYTSGVPGSVIFGTVLETNSTDETGTIDTARAIAVDSESRAYVAGTASGTLFTSANAYQSAVAGGTDAFLLRIEGGGWPIDYATYLGGSGNDQGLGVAVDSSFSAYVTGATQSMNFPTINPISNPNTNFDLPLAGMQGAFVTKFNANGVGLLLSSYMGGSGADQGNAVAVDGNDNIYVAGTTSSNDFLTSLLPNTYNATSNTYTFSPYVPPQQTYGGNGDAFLAMIQSASLPSTSVMPGSLAFTGQALNSVSAPQAVQYTVQGTSTVHITSIEFDNTEFQQDFRNNPNSTTNGADCLVGPIGLNVTPSSTGCTIWVTFTPTNVSQTQSGHLYIQDDTGTTPHQVNLTGTGAVPTESLSPSSLTFLSQTVGVPSAVKTVTLTNASNSATIFISSIEVTGTNASDFVETDNCIPQVAAGANCTISVTFTPLASGTRVATLVITDNAAGSPHSIQLSGTGASNSSGGTGSGTMSLSPATLSFTQAGSQSVTLTNTSSSATLTISSTPQISGTGASVFSLGSGTTCGAGTVVAANGTCTIQVTYTPNSTITAPTATLSVSSNAVSNPTQTVTLVAGAAANGFTLTPANGGGESVTQGGTATFSVAVATTSSTAETISFTCFGTGSVNGTTVNLDCSVAPKQVSVSNAAGSSVIVTVNTNTSSSSRSVQPSLHSRSVFLALLPFTFFGMLLIRKRRGAWLVCMLVALALLMGLVSCSSGNSSSGSTGSGGALPAGTYTLTLTGTANTAPAQTSQATLTLVVNAQ